MSSVWGNLKLNIKLKKAYKIDFTVIFAYNVFFIFGLLEKMRILLVNWKIATNND